MEAAKFKLVSLKADIVAQDINGQILLLVEVKATAGHRGIDQLIAKLQDANILIPFAMLVDLENIHIFQWDGSNLSAPIASLKTATVLRNYDVEVGIKRIFERYLITLVEAWLRDLAYNWKSEMPPASEQIAAIGLLQRLKGGTTQAEVAIGGDTLR